MATGSWKAPVEGAARGLQRALWSQGKALRFLAWSSLGLHEQQAALGRLPLVQGGQGTWAILTSENVKTRVTAVGSMAVVLGDPAINPCKLFTNLVQVLSDILEHTLELTSPVTLAKSR